MKSMKAKNYLETIRITFDKQEIRKNISDFSFREARRYNSNIYDVLLNELYEDYCVITAKYFEYLVHLENKLISNADIRDRLSDEPKILLTLYDICKIAEKAVLANPIEGTKTCASLLLQCLYHCDRLVKKYEWFVSEVYDIILKVCKRLYNSKNKKDVDEMLCMIFYKSAQFISKKDKLFAINLLHTALEAAQCTPWSVDMIKPIDDEQTLLSTTIAKYLTKTLIEVARNIVHTDVVRAIKYAEDALKSMSGSNINSTSKLFLLTYLDLTYFYIEAMKYDKARNALEFVKHKIDNCHLEGENHDETLSKYYHYAGMFYERINKKELALRYHLDCVEFSRKKNLKEFVAKSLFQLGKVYTSFGSVQYRLAEKYLIEAKTAFIEEKDFSSVRMCRFVNGVNKFTMVYPLIYDLIRLWGKSPCDRYRLLEWKNRCVPFWVNIFQKHQLEKRNPIRCALIRRNEDPLSKHASVSNFKRHSPKVDE